MAQQGYWVVCEDIYAKNQDDKEPILFMGRVDGFDNAEAMGGTRMEVLTVVRRKLKENIRFLLDCYNEVPIPSNSDNPPSGLNKTNTACLFLGLKEIGIPAEMLSALAA